MATVRTNMIGTYDDLTQLRDASAVTVSGADTISATAVTLDVSDGYISGHFLVNVTAVDVTDGDELYEIKLQGSNVTGGTFNGEIVDLVTLPLGAAGVLSGTGNKTTNLYKIPFCNQFGNETFRYLRSYHKITASATVDTGINYTAGLTK